MTMTDDYFANHLVAANMTVGVPDSGDRTLIHNLQIRLAAGKNPPEIRAQFVTMLKKYSVNYDAVVLACTELPMAIDQSSTTMIVVNPLQLQCDSAVEFALS